MIYRVFIMLTLLAVALYYIVCFLQIFGIIQFTKNEVTIPKMFIPFYYLIKKEPEPEPEPEPEKPKRKKPTYTKPIKTKEGNE